MLILIVLTAPLHAEKAQGGFQCEIVSVDLLAMEDGKPKKYTGYKGGMKIGHSLDYQYEVDTEVGFFKVSEKAYSFKRRYAANNNASGYIKGRAQDFKDTNTNAYSTRNGSIHITSESLNVSLSEGEVDLYRYYKEDWHGIYFKTGIESIVTAGLDCRHISNNFERIFRGLKKSGF